MVLHIIIVGAGTTGLLLAQGLKQAGIKATVYERETPEMHWGAQSVNKLLSPELRGRIKEAWTDPTVPDNSFYELPIYAGHSGELLGKTPDRSMRVTRRKMRKLFSEGIDIQYGKHLCAITKTEEGVTSTFADGTSVSGHLVVGCDSANSTTRQLLLGDAGKVDYLDLTMLNFTCKFDVETARLIRATHPFAFNSYHPANRMLWVSAQDIGDPDDPETWTFQLIISWPGPPRAGDTELADQAARTAYLKAMAPEYAQPWRTIIERIPDDIKFGTDKVSSWRPFDWSTTASLAGVATLAGDAAHPFPPYRGQGLNTGLEDAAELVTELAWVKSGLGELAAAVQRYEKSMLTRAHREFPLSEKSASAAHDFRRIHEHPILKIGLDRASGSVAQ
ncbi:FAD-dependent oxidoreductase [Aspergillus foveolatus]|uniref:FAD-dependent oxidoreductase n=1 Tax=Aspergillus foveolatus TaxID=210207 RepID=UPI003CCDDE63